MMLTQVLIHNLCVSVSPRLQTKVDVTQMESIQGHQAEMEGEDTIEQCDLALLAHPV